jgi:signal transduction histidine kinase
MIINATHAIQEKYKDSNEKLGLIIISTSQDEKDVIIKVSDNGSGISPTIINKIFDPFFTTKEVGKGTGQGLAIAHDIIVNKHKGYINVTSELGKGTTFIIKIPKEKNGNK